MKALFYMVYQKPLVMLAVLLGCLAFASCENDINEVRALDRKDTSVEVGKGIVGYMSEGGKVKAKLTAPIMTRSDKDSAVTIFPKSITVLLYDDSTKVNTHVFAKYGRYLGRSSMIMLRDSVLIYNINKDTMRTSLLYWDQTHQQMYTPRQVWVHRMQPLQQYIHARGGMNISTQNMNNYTFYDMVIGSFMQYSEMSLGPGGMQEPK